MMNEKALCTARELAIGYGKTPLLSDICLGVQPGQILTLIGPNGAGKSTLLRTLAGQLAPMGGTVLLAGKDLTAYTGTERAKKLALMAPHSRRMELTTCFDFVSAGRYPYTGRLGILSAEDRQQVHRALELVGAAHLADRDFNRISDGQRQRILLARALCQQPEVILLDEPTSFLDIKGKIELLTILKELAHTGQLAVILSLHELELAEKIADTVVCVSPGGVSGVLTPEQAFQPENIRTLYGLTEQQYTALFGTPEPEAEKAPAGKPQFEHYVRSGQELLRCGYTTGHLCRAGGCRGGASAADRPRTGNGGSAHAQGHCGGGGSPLVPQHGHRCRMCHPQGRRRRCGCDYGPAGGRISGTGTGCPRRAHPWRRGGGPGDEVRP